MPGFDSLQIPPLQHKHFSTGGPIIFTPLIVCDASSCFRDWFWSTAVDSKRQNSWGLAEIDSMIPTTEVGIKQISQATTSLEKWHDGCRYEHNDGYLSSGVAKNNCGELMTRGSIRGIAVSNLCRCLCVRANERLSTRCGASGLCENRGKKSMVSVTLIAIGIYAVISARVHEFFATLEGIVLASECLHRPCWWWSWHAVLGVPITLRYDAVNFNDASIGSKWIEILRWRWHTKSLGLKPLLRHLLDIWSWAHCVFNSMPSSPCGRNSVWVGNCFVSIFKKEDVAHYPERLSWMAFKSGGRRHRRTLFPLLVHLPVWIDNFWSPKPPVASVQSTRIIINYYWKVYLKFLWAPRFL